MGALNSFEELTSVNWVFSSRPKQGPNSSSSSKGGGRGRGARRQQRKEKGRRRRERRQREKEEEVLRRRRRRRRRKKKGGGQEEEKWVGKTGGRPKHDWFCEEFGIQIGVGVKGGAFFVAGDE
jgi:hypothetical protein